MATKTRFILTDHAIERFEERFGSASIHAALAEAVPYGGNQRRGEQMLIAPTLGCVFCVTADGVVTTALTEMQSLANIQKNGKGRAADKWKVPVLIPQTAIRKPDKKTNYVFVGEVSESWPEMVKQGENKTIARITTEHTKDSFHELSQKNREKYIKEVMRECGVPCTKSVYDTHKSNVLYACYKIWRGESL
jgi:hypothetical protein